MAFKRKKSVNYLTKTELLAEIQKSKISYSQFDDPKYHHYDLIVEDVKKLSVKRNIELAKKNRAKRLNDEIIDKLLAEGKTEKEIHDYLKKEGFKPSKIEKTDLVFRVMTNEHIPDIKNKHDKIVKAAVNFPPFQHYAFVKNKWKSVGKSHWKNGKFCTNHGNITNKLATALMKLTQRYSSRGNWRGYTYVDEMIGNALVRLCQTCLQFNETKSSDPFAYYTEIIYHNFVSTLNNEKGSANLKNKLIQESGFNASFNEMAQQDIDGSSF